jgi:hypothetical protein
VIETCIQLTMQTPYSVIQIQTLPRSENITLAPHTHYLVVAEDGFSMLRQYGEQAGLDRKTIKAFADEVNRRDEGGSLYPQAPISAIPRRYLRDCGDNPDEAMVNSFKTEIQRFLAANHECINARRIIIDLHVDSRPIQAAYLSQINVTQR